ncbi:MAG TPA: hypothetical protein VJZ93_01145 [Candidatus Nanoarchaeia archaeon]|nr:hypothetical protein [Candidatus Nanoarchaeia archaeon]
MSKEDINLEGMVSLVSDLDRRIDEAIEILKLKRHTVPEGSDEKIFPYAKHLVSLLSIRKDTLMYIPRLKEYHDEGKYDISISDIVGQLK